MAIGEVPSGLPSGKRECWLMGNANGWREIGPAIGILAVLEMQAFLMGGDMDPDKLTDQRRYDTRMD